MRARQRPLLVVVAVVVLLAAVGVWALLTGPREGAAASPSSPSPSPEPTATSGAPDVAAAPTPTPAAEEVPMAAPERLEIPDVGIDLAVRPIDPVQGRIDPPTVADAYWIEDYGTPGTDADNTVYLVGHSSLRLDAAFNPLLDVEHQDSVLEPGDTVLLTTATGTLEYEVEGWRRYEKAGLPAAEEVWAIDPGRLALITCFQEDGREFADDNLVVTARLVGSAPVEVG